MSDPVYPTHAGSERSQLDAWLDFQRAGVLRKIAGADDSGLRQPMVGSGLTLLGVVKHLAYVERWWFQVCLANEAEPAFDESDPDADFRVEPGETTEDIVALYKRMCERSRQISAAASLEDVAKRPDRDHTLRWIMIHMIEETARHAGHMDIMREQLDGVTGM